MLVPGDVDHIKRNWDSPKIEKLSYPLLPPDFHSPGSHLAPAQPMKNMAVWWYTCKNETWVFFLRRMKKICRWKRSMGFGRGYGVEYRGSRVKCRRSRVKCRGSSKWQHFFLKNILCKFYRRNSVILSQSTETHSLTSEKRRLVIW